MLVEHVMSHPVVTCTPHDSLNEAARLMWEHDCGALAIVTPPGILVGVITDRDVCMAVYTSGKPIGAILVGDIMARELITCRFDEPIEAVEERMSAAGVRRLPVVDDDGVPVGVVSLSDLARAVMKGSRREQRQTVATLAAVGAPRHA